MPSSKVTVDNTLGQEEAMRRIKTMLAGSGKDATEQISDLEETWTDSGGTFSGKVKGMKVSGSLDVRDTEVEMDISYPMAARPFKGKIESMLREKAESVLAP